MIHTYPSPNHAHRHGYRACLGLRIYRGLLLRVFACHTTVFYFGATHTAFLSIFCEFQNIRLIMNGGSPTTVATDCSPYWLLQHMESVVFTWINLHLPCIVILPPKSCAIHTGDTHMGVSHGNFREVRGEHG